MSSPSYNYQLKELDLTMIHSELQPRIQYICNFNNNAYVAQELQLFYTYQIKYARNQMAYRHAC